VYLTRSEYDHGVSTFSPDGRLFQVEYAVSSIKLGSTAVGVQTAEGVVLAVEKRITSKLIEARSVEKIFQVDHHVGAAMSGMAADARTLIEHARVQAQSHTFTYDEPMNIEALTQATCDLALQFGEDNDSNDDDEGEAGAQMSRPFGVALLIGGVDADGPKLFHADPSGTFTRYDAMAIGAGGEGALHHLEQQYNKSLSLHDATTLALETLREVMEEKIDKANVEIAVIPLATKKFRVYTPDETAAALARLDAA
jgi:20S proteasome subunit alpha 5